MAVALIAALADNGVIGNDNGLPWRLPADLRRFRRLTLGHWLVMGRRTFDGLGRPLPGRETVVLTRQRGYTPAGAQVAHSLLEALALARGAEVFIAGGAEVYGETLARGLADRLWLTRIHRDFAGDTFFPELDLRPWRLVTAERLEPDGEAPFAYSFLRYERGAAE
jgi:dihydrofolate reductase